jgi:hypothetical protein
MGVSPADAGWPPGRRWIDRQMLHERIVVAERTPEVVSQPKDDRPPTGRLLVGDLEQYDGRGDRVSPRPRVV